MALFQFEGEIKHETEKAYLVNDGTQEIWIPKSQVGNNGPIEMPSGLHGFDIPEWLAEEKGLV